MNWLRIARKARGYSLRELAGFMRTYPARLWRVEVGLAKPTYMEMCNLSTALEVLHEAMFCLPPRYADPKEALEMVLHQLAPHQRERVVKLVEEARRTLAASIGHGISAGGSSSMPCPFAPLVEPTVWWYLSA